MYSVSVSRTQALTPSQRQGPAARAWPTALAEAEQARRSRGEGEDPPRAGAERGPAPPACLAPRLTS